MINKSRSNEMSVYIKTQNKIHEKPYLEYFIMINKECAHMVYIKTQTNVMKTLSVDTVLTPVFENVVSQWNRNKIVLLKD